MPPASTDPADSPHFSLPKHPPFQRFWCTRILSSLSFQMLAVAMGWHVYALTHSAFALGLVGLAQFLPMFLLTLVVGHVADRYDRRRIAAVCQSLESVAALLFAIGTFSGWISAPVIYVLAACVGASRAFESPAVSSLLPAVVPRGYLPKATAWSTSANQTAQIAGPALGGLLYGIGPGAAYLACTLSFAAAAASVWSIPLQVKPASRAPVTLESIFSGIAFIRREPVILGALSLDLFAVLFGGATALLPIFARDVLHAGPIGLGLLRSGTAIGALAGTIWLAHFPLRNRPGAAMFGGVIAFGIATIVFGLSHQFLVSLLALMVLGASDTISVVVRLSLVQLRTPDEMLGRVSAVNSLFIGTSNQLGEFESGLTAGWWGAQPAVLVGGVATIAIALLWMRFFPELRHTRTLEREEEALAASA
ncbi:MULTISPECIES: MFS transporter [Paraburkholderia]|uniref:MFS family permease n=1 Tax=Paraburkholderia youngii TaxID=2782701 RepID=A0A7Y6N1S4_9BURK|nr:MFS transporter [Paraburkholderia youngii]MBB5399125.1 MFS family permease [Paraburkholderia youngii]NUX56117.1 MFS transporter [Paraburkholderia youngii]NUY02689.1 MFS transporter [Paraburkholderia youngii]NVI07869.1 MFS transporter [Paraburkholderia youngii]